MLSMRNKDISFNNNNSAKKFYMILDSLSEEKIGG